MKRIGWIAVLLMLAAFGAMALAADQKSAGPWKLIVESRIDHKSTIAGFWDEKNGITAGYSGECHYTENAGKSWPSGTNFSACRFGLEIVDAHIAWTCGNQGNIRMSDDGGRSWTPVSNYGKTEPYQCRYISFIDKNTGWVASPYGMFAMTTDGGAGWSELKLPEGTDDIAAISLIGPNVGYVLDMSGILYKTTDAGKTWTAKDSAFKDAPMQMNLSAPQEAMRFLDEKRGIIVACMNDGKIHAAVTVDGGQTWTRELIPSAMGVLFLSRDGRILTVSQGKIIRAFQRAAL